MTGEIIDLARARASKDPAPERREPERREPERREPVSTREQPSALLEWLRRGVTSLSIAWAIAIALVFALRVGFPLELEWMEGGSLQQAHRVQHGLPVYGPPSPEFVPFLYPPLYPALLALLGFVLPLGYVLARMVSICAVLATCVGLWRIARFEDKPVAHRALTVGLFLSGYVFCFRWLDLARGDALFLALLVWGLALLRESEDQPWGRAWTKAALAGLLVALAFWTKQTAAVFVLASGMVGLLVAPRMVWIYAGVIALIDGGGVLLGQWLTDGWLWTWIYEMHQSHAFNAERFRSKTWGMFIHAAPMIALLLVVMLGVGLGLGLRRMRQLRRLLAEYERTGSVAQAWVRSVWLGLRAVRGPIYWGVLAGAGLLVSALGYSTQFAEPNAFIPGVCFGAVFLGVALPDATLRRDDLAGVQRLRQGVEVFGLLLISLQLSFALLVEPMYQPIQSHGLEQGLPDSYAWQDPWRTIPRADQRARAAALRREIEARDGERLLALHRPWWPILAGGHGHVGAMGINDVSETQRGELLLELRRRVRSNEIDAVWIEGSVPAWLAPELRGWTVLQRRWGDERVRPLSGWMSEAGMVTPYGGEQLLLGPAQPRAVPDGVEVLADFEDGSLDGFEVVDGVAFGRRAVQSFSARMPPLGPHGGARLLSSAASSQREKARGEIRSAPFVLPAGGAVELLLGTSGSSAGLRAELVADDGRRHALELPRTRFDLGRVHWFVSDDWAGAEVRLHLVDDDPDAALFADDLWLVREPSRDR